MSWTKPSANALRNALKQEKTRFDRAESLQFVQQRQREQSASSTQRYPRTLDNHTFFTPHLSRRAPDKTPSGITSSYVVIVPENPGTLTATISYNPVRDKGTRLPPNLSLQLKSRIYSLEKSGFTFIGTNRDIHVFEKQYNQRQRGREWAWKSAAVLGVSVATLTAALFTGEYLYK